MSHACHRFWNYYKTVILLTFDKVHNPSRLPRETASERPKGACTFSTSQLPKVLRECCASYILTSKCATSAPNMRCSVFCILTWKRASRHTGVQFFTSHLPRWLRTRRFSKPTFQPSGADGQEAMHELHDRKGCDALQTQRPPEPVGPPLQRSQQYLKTEDLPGVRVWRVGGDFIPQEIWLEEVAVVQGKLVAIDWHQVTDVCRYSGRRHVQAADNGQVPVDVATFYNKVNRRLRPGNLQVIISHIERSEDNLRRVWKRQSSEFFCLLEDNRRNPGSILPFCARKMHEAGTFWKRRWHCRNTS